jgi:hypothetical protein
MSQSLAERLVSIREEFARIDRLVKVKNGDFQAHADERRQCILRVLLRAESVVESAFLSRSSAQPDEQLALRKAREMVVRAAFYAKHDFAPEIDPKRDDYFAGRFEGIHLPLEVRGTDDQKDDLWRAFRQSWADSKRKRLLDDYLDCIDPGEVEGIIILLGGTPLPESLAPIVAVAGEPSNLAREDNQNGDAPIEPVEEWIPATEARKLALSLGVSFSLQTMRRAADAKPPEFRWRDGSAGISYEVERESFLRWVVARKQSK